MKEDSSVVWAWLSGKASFCGKMSEKITVVFVNKLRSQANGILA